MQSSLNDANLAAYLKSKQPEQEPSRIEHLERELREVKAQLKRITDYLTRDPQ